jgi:hypothetical protein
MAQAPVTGKLMSASVMTDNIQSLMWSLIGMVSMSGLSRQRADGVDDLRRHGFSGT